VSSIQRIILDICYPIYDGLKGPSNLNDPRPKDSAEEKEKSGLLQAAY
jgi:hypothetical protein